MAKILSRDRYGVTGFEPFFSIYKLIISYKKKVLQIVTERQTECGILSFEEHSWLKKKNSCLTMNKGKI